MRFNCQSCKAKYQIADEKVAGKTVRMKCRKCGELIQVRAGEGDDGPVASYAPASSRRPPPPKASPPASAPGRAGPPRPAGVPRSAAGRLGVGPPRPGAAPARSKEEDEATVVMRRSPLDIVLAATAKKATVAQPEEELEEWYVGIDNKPVGPIGVSVLRGHLEAGRITKSSLVWKEDLPDWRPLESFAELARRVGLTTPSSRPPPSSVPAPKASAPVALSRVKSELEGDDDATRQAPLPEVDEEVATRGLSPSASDPGIPPAAQAQGGDELDEPTTEDGTALASAAAGAEPVEPGDVPAAVDEAPNLALADVPAVAGDPGAAVSEPASAPSSEASEESASGGEPSGAGEPSAASEPHAAAAPSAASWSDVPLADAEDPPTEDSAPPREPEPPAATPAEARVEGDAPASAEAEPAPAFARAAKADEGRSPEPAPPTADAPPEQRVDVVSAPPPAAAVTPEQRVDVVSAPPPAPRAAAAMVPDDDLDELLGLRRERRRRSRGMHPVAYAFIAMAAAFGGVAAWVLLSPAPVPVGGSASSAVPTSTGSARSAATTSATAVTLAPIAIPIGSGGRALQAVAGQGSSGPGGVGAPQPTGTAAAGSDVDPVDVSAFGPIEGPAPDGPGAGPEESGGGLSPAQLGAVVNANKGVVSGSCMSFVTSSGVAGSARVNVAISVGPSGRVTGASVSGGEQFPGLASCVQSRVMSWVFPKSGGATSVNVPFHFIAQ